MRGPGKSCRRADRAPATPSGASPRLNLKVRPDDRLTERDVAGRLGRGRTRLAIADHAVVELEQFALERRLIGDRFHRPPRPRAVGTPSLEHQLGGRAAQEGGWEDQGGPALWAEERELLAVAGDTILQVDPGHRRRRLGKVDVQADRR